MTPPILARVAQLHGSSEDADCDTISTTTSWEYVSKSSSLSDLTRFGAAFVSSSSRLLDITTPARVSSQSQQSQNGRSLLPHGVVPLPPPHRNPHNYGIHHHRTSQKDLIQGNDEPRHSIFASRVGSTSTSATKDDSNPVMRSASFNLDYCAAKRPNFRLRQPSHPHTPFNPASNCHSKISARRSNPQPQPQPETIDNIENDSGGDLYNDPVPYQSEIYSLPVDSLVASSTSTACNNGLSQHNNQNQRLKSETKSSSKGPAPPLPKNNLNRRKSQDSDNQNHGVTSHQESSPASDLQSQPPPPQTEERKSCRPPQRWSSLSTQPTSSSSIVTKEEIAAALSPQVPLLSSSSSAFASKVGTSTKQLNVELKILNNQPPPPLYSVVTKNKKLVPPERSTSNAAGHALNGSEFTNRTGEGGSTGFSKKPRSRSVDPTGNGTTMDSHLQGNQQNHSSHHKNSLKRPVGSTLSNAEKNSNATNLNFDNPSSSPTTEPAAFSDPLQQHGKETADRRNPLGLSFLNLFRRNKGGKQTQTLKTEHLEDFSNHVTQMEENNVDRSIISGNSNSSNNNPGVLTINNNNKEDASYYFRELPPPPPGHSESGSSCDEQSSPSPMECRDFAASIERVKDCGWYWGPLSSEAAEDLLRNEPDGSFIVRDSSDARYIFSLTFKLHGLVRHVRIEHDQGNFSFGPLTRFKAATIVDFVEKAVAHSRSGRYLFFLHRRPVLGPMQVQLLHPYSRFMHPRSLKHMCRFVILKFVRKDLIHTLPLPKPLQDYLNTPHYYFESPDSNSTRSTTASSQHTSSKI